MTSNPLTAIEELRLAGLKLLHGTTAQYTAPKSDTLASALRDAGVSMSGPALSDIYLRKTAITESLARRIEAAMGLGASWLEADHSAYLKASAEDIAVVRKVLSLPSNARKALGVLISQTNSDA